MKDHFHSTSFSIGDTKSALDMLRFGNDREGSSAINQLSAQHGGSNIEANLWLPFAAKELRISPNLRDYIVIPVPILISDMPNTNGDSLSIGELLRFDPNLGMQMFKTFRGKPTFLEHDNEDHTKAKGVILDAFIRPLKGFGNGKYWKLVLLLAFDRTKDPMLAAAIASGENNSYSLGFYFKSYTCSICNQRFGQGGLKTPCSHTKPKRAPYRMPDGRLAYRRCEFANGFETSAVANPAYVIAINSNAVDLSKL